MSNFLIPVGKDEVIFQERVYTNYMVNMDLVRMFKKGLGRNSDNDLIVPIIKFFFIWDGEVAQWHFASIEERNSMYTRLVMEFVKGM